MVLAEAVTETDLVKMLMERPPALWAFILARFGPIAVGFGLALAAIIRRQDRKRLGEPPPLPATLTVPFATPEAIGLLVAGFFVLPYVMTWILTGGDLANAPLWTQIVGMGIGSVPVAVLVLLRRQRLRLQAAENPEAFAEDVFGEGTGEGGRAPIGAPTRPPGLARASLLGLKTVCIALMVSTPVALLWTLVIRAMTGEQPPLQTLVNTAIDPSSTYEPWLIAAFGVIIAPLTEEALFRGLLYPAFRRTLVRFGRTETRATWTAAIAVSLLFAAVHGSMLALAPLFVLAMVLTWVMQRTNSLAACIVAHMAHNALSMVPLLVLRMT